MNSIAHAGSRIRSRGMHVLNLGLTLVVLVLSLYLVMSIKGSLANGAGTVPQSVALEKATGVRFSRVAVVGDEGLLTVSYVVLDPEKATVFQSDLKHPPLLSSESRQASTRRVSIMRAGHAMRAGQTYYLVYQNSGGALRSGEQVTVTFGHLHLRHFPVL